MTSKSLAAAVGIVAVTLTSIGAYAAEVNVLCANGMKAVVTELHPQLERTNELR